MQSRRKHALAKIINHDRRLHGWMLMTLLLIMMMVMVEAYITIAHTHCKWWPLPTGNAAYRVHGGRTTMGQTMGNGEAMISHETNPRRLRVGHRFFVVNATVIRSNEHFVVTSWQYDLHVTPSPLSGAASLSPFSALLEIRAADEFIAFPFITGQCNLSIAVDPTLCDCGAFQCLQLAGRGMQNSELTRAFCFVLMRKP